jgi:hypothetical protein
MHIQSGKVTVEVQLPRPLSVNRGRSVLRLPMGGLVGLEIHFNTESSSEECHNIIAHINFKATIRWMKTGEDFQPLLVCGENIQFFDPANFVIMNLLWILELAALESVRPYVYDDFVKDIKSLSISVSGVDSYGGEIKDLAYPQSFRPIVGVGSYVTNPDIIRNFPSLLLSRAIPVLASYDGPYWEYWKIGYYASLRAMLRYGNLHRHLREAVTSFQTAIESAMISLHEWTETRQYGNSAILQYPASLQPELQSLLLTRNLLLHRGQVKRKICRPGESYKDASRRSSDCADGELTHEHLLKYAEISFSALLLSETGAIIIT